MLLLRRCCRRRRRVGLARHIRHAQTHVWAGGGGASVATKTFPLAIAQLLETLQHRWLEIWREFACHAHRVLAIDARLLGSNIGILGLCRRGGHARDGHVGALHGHFEGALRGIYRGRDAVTEFARTRQEQMLLLLAGDQYVVLVFALLDGAVPEGGYAIAVLAIVIPLSLVSAEREGG